MSKLMVGLFVILMMACTTSQKAEPKILSTALPEYLVRVNFVLFTQEIAQAPVTSQAFQNALGEWADVLPIECAVFLEPPATFPFNLDSMANQRGVIRVRIVDIHAPPYNQPFEILGFWDWGQNLLALDRMTLELDAEMAHVVALHELGHVFGLPHFLNIGAQIGSTGSYMIPAEFDARELIMFPVVGNRNKSSKLTKLEATLAWKNFRGLQEVGRNDCFQLTSHCK